MLGIVQQNIHQKCLYLLKLVYLIRCNNEDCNTNAEVMICSIRKVFDNCALKYFLFNLNPLETWLCIILKNV